VLGGFSIVQELTFGPLQDAVSASINTLASARPAYVLAALSLYIASLFIVGARWRGFVRALGGEVGVIRATLATLAGIAVANVTPSTRLSGEACRIALVRLAGSATWRQATVAAVWDRLSEIPPIVVLTIVAAFALPHLRLAPNAGIAAGVVAVGLGIGVLAFRRWRCVIGPAPRWSERLALDRINGRVVAAGVGYSSLLWLQDMLRVGCAALAVGVVLSPEKIALLSMLAMVGGLLPSVGGVGPVEGSLVAGLMALGVDLPTATAVMTVERGVSYAFSTGTGAVVVFLLGGRSLWTAVRRREQVAD
jgi:uncharacterized membrane protein YbhN (UPF0104 family)